MSSSIFKAQRALLVDDVREEVGGKLTLVGAVSPTFAFRSFPTQKRLSIVVVGDLLDAGTGEIEFRLTLPGGESKRQKIEMEVTGVDLGVMVPLSPVAVEIKEPGPLVLAVGRDDEWETIQEWHIEHDARDAPDADVDAAASEERAGQ